MKNTQLKNIFELNFSILLISSAAVLVRFIPLSPSLLAFWRGAIAFVVLGLYLLYQKKSFKITDKKARLRLLTSSALFALHWVTYFYALQVSSVAIGMLSLYTFPVITAFIEPFYFKTNFNKRHLALAALVLVGLYIMSPEINFSNNDTKGIISGVFSAVFFAMRNLTMKSNSSRYDSSLLMFYQFLFMWIVFIPFIFIDDTSETSNFLPYLLGLGIFTTAIGHTIFVKSLKNFAVSTASIIASSQPVFGIILAMIFLNEIPNINTLIGGALILSTVFIESYLNQKS
ncbi:DMT family transporter [Flavicella marina]|uniref:DMT family transporter n=1 Tax=Flavicella marina TaxID=1475951 RepID=UPI001263F3CB|nr:DMT family transporter [Flavicella marina]